MTPPPEDHSPASGCPAEREGRIRRRNEEVVRHLGLAHHVAERFLKSSGCRGGATPEDVHAIACMGLVRCVDRFDPSQGHRFSSYAVPYIMGAIRQQLRDQWNPLKVPRRLMELQQRSVSLQNRRLKAGLPPLRGEQLAAALDTTAERLQEAQRAWELMRVQSLDGLAWEAADTASEGLVEHPEWWEDPAAT